MEMLLVADGMYLQGAGWVFHLAFYHISCFLEIPALLVPLVLRLVTDLGGSEEFWWEA